MNKALRLKKLWETPEYFLSNPNLLFLSLIKLMTQILSKICPICEICERKIKRKEILIQMLYPKKAKKSDFVADEALCYYFRLERINKVDSLFAGLK
ncbi:hypothetical protein [Chryseobacterium sp. M5A1_1a]